jgi:hypothetical protein
MVPQQGAPESRLVQFMGLDHGAHGPVEHQDALAGQSIQFISRQSEH